MKDFNVEIGNRIRILREKHGYSREKLSEKSEIGTKFLYEIETGKKGMSAYTLYHISLALNVSCDYLLTGNDSDNDFSYIENILSTIDKDKFPCIEKIINNLAQLAK